MMDYYANASVKCPACGGPLFGDEKYCTTCGVELATLNGAQGGLNFADTVVGTCPHCGGPLYRDDSFCTNCGADVPNASGTVVVQSGGGKTIRADDSGLTGVPGGQYGKGTVPIGGVDSPPAGGGAPIPTDGGYVPPKPTDGGDDDFDEPLVRPVLVHLTREEARMGCRKHVMVDGQSVPVDVPAGANVHTVVDIPNLGYRDERTGTIGPLRVCFHVA